MFIDVINVYVNILNIIVNIMLSSHCVIIMLVLFTIIDLSSLWKCLCRGVNIYVNCYLLIYFVC